MLCNREEVLHGRCKMLQPRKVPVKALNLFFKVTIHTANVGLTNVELRFLNQMLYAKDTCHPGCMQYLS